MHVRVCVRVRVCVSVRVGGRVRVHVRVCVSACACVGAYFTGWLETQGFGAARPKHGPLPRCLYLQHCHGPQLCRWCLQYPWLEQPHPS